MNETMSMFMSSDSIVFDTKPITPQHLYRPEDGWSPESYKMASEGWRRFQRLTNRGMSAYALLRRLIGGRFYQRKHNLSAGCCCLTMSKFSLLLGILPKAIGEPILGQLRVGYIDSWTKFPRWNKRII